MPEQDLDEKHHILQKPVDGDLIEKTIGALGPWQVFTTIILGLVKFAVAWHQLSIVFLAPPSSFQCANETDKCQNCTNHIFDRSVFIETIVTQWDLVCDRAQLANVAQTVTMWGILAGNMLFGYFSDKYGRRGPMIWAVVLQTLSGTLTAFVPWFGVFLALRFITALAVGGGMVVSFVLIMEIIGLKWRTTFGILYQVPFTLGHLTLPLFAYWLRDWRHLQIAISLPTILLISYYWLLSESPRWLLTVGKPADAIKILEKAAKFNKLPIENIEEDVRGYPQKVQSTGNFYDLLRTPVMRKHTLSIGFNWFVCGLCFFGGSQYIGQLGGDIFVNVALSAVIGLPSVAFSIWAVKAWGRKPTLIFSQALSGIASVLIGIVPVTPSYIRTTLSVLVMFGLTTAFPTVYIYSGELFPTIVRNIGVGTSSMCARIGSMIAPFIAGLVLIQNWLPPLVFGLTPLIAAVLCLNLPETLDCKLPDTIQEAEDSGNSPPEFHSKD